MFNKKTNIIEDMMLKSKFYIVTTDKVPLFKGKGNETSFVECYLSKNDLVRIKEAEPVIVSNTRFYKCVVETGQYAQRNLLINEKNILNSFKKTLYVKAKKTYKNKDVNLIIKNRKYVVDVVTHGVIRIIDEHVTKFTLENKHISKYVDLVE